MINENFAEIIPSKLFFGNAILARNDDELKKMKVKVIIDLIDYIKPEDVIKHSNDFEYINEPVADFPDNNINWAEKLASIIEKRIKDNQVVYVHCVQGMSRSAALILYYLITREHKTMREAFDFVKSIRPVLCPTFGFMTGLCELDTKVHGKSSFSLDEYAINCLCESFPMASKGEVSELYSKAKEEVKKNPMVCEPIKVKEHIAPIGYLCFDMLKKKFGEEKIIRRTGCSLYHPF